MQYRAVGNRCAVVLDSLNLPISNVKALEILIQKGFLVLEVDIIGLARKCIDVSKYFRGARFSQAPMTVDCSSFVKWLYSKRGIWLPRRSIQQCELGEEVSINELVEGDLIFISGSIDYYQNDPSIGIGHVGIFTANNTVIHAANKKLNVVEIPIEKFIGNDKFRSARRYMPNYIKTLTLETPPKREVETSDDIKWIVLQSL